MEAAGDAHLHAILSAVKRGDLDEVRRLVQQDRQLLDADYHGATPLKAAASAGRLKVVRYLLDEAAEINRRPGGTISALETACLTGRWEVVVLLLARGADISPSDCGYTPLHMASPRGHADVCSILLAHGCGDVNHQDSHGITALHLASAYGHVDVMMVLRGAGADPLMVDQEGDTPLSFAVMRGHAACVALLQVGASMFSRLALFIAALHCTTPGPPLINIPPTHAHRSGSAATSSPRPAASAMPLPRCASARQATLP
jgi:uncharacterized protein